MKGTVKVLNQRGHDAVEFDTDAGVVEEAEAVLANAALSSAALFDGQTQEQIRRGGSDVPGNRQVLEEHEEVLVVNPIAGG